jgi:adenylylsulfate kinase
MINNSRIFSFLKAITWRIIGTLDTIFISYFFTKNTIVAFSIGGVEVITKSFLFYVHDRIWLRVIAKMKNNKRVLNNPLSISKNIYILEKWEIDRVQKEKRLNQRGKVIWMTGLSGSGKTTLTNQLEKKTVRRKLYLYSLRWGCTKRGN